MSGVDSILELARWAPSGDNSQPWRFEVVSDHHVVVHAFSQGLGVYDLLGRAEQLSIGGLLETLRIAASAHHREAHIERRHEAAGLVFDVRLEPGDVAVDPLASAIRVRSVQRRPLSTRPLGTAAKQALQHALGPGHRVRWFEGWQARSRMAWLAVRSSKIRLTIPEAYAVHRQIIEWDARFSEDRVPDQALGADPLTVRMMRWLLADWKRVSLMNRWFGGTLAPRLQLDLLPGLFCGAHFALIAARPPRDVDDYLAAGAAAQRFWLTATTLQLQLQPQHTPLMFAAYAREGVPFTEAPGAQERAAAIAVMLTHLLGADAEAAVFLGRVGSGSAASARSLRLPLERLRWVPPAAKN